jgi:hypothetical protein
VSAAERRGSAAGAQPRLPTARGRHRTEVKGEGGVDPDAGLDAAEHVEHVGHDPGDVALARRARAARVRTSLPLRAGLDHGREHRRRRALHAGSVINVFNLRYAMY